MSSKITITFIMDVESDGTATSLSVIEEGLPPEEDEDNPQTPQGIVSAKIHEAVRATIHAHNENVFRKEVTRSRS